MSKYDGCYVKLPGDPTFWAVDNGKCYKIADAEMMYQYGLRPVKVISLEEFGKLAILDESPKAPETGDEEE